MKNILIPILFLILLFSCNKENIVPITNDSIQTIPVDTISIIQKDPILFGVYINQPIKEIYNLFVDTPTCNPIKFIGINETGVHNVWVFPRDTIVVAYIIFSELVDRNTLYDSEYLNQVSTMYNYGINNNILFPSPIVRDLMIIDTTLASYRHELYSQRSGKDAIFELKGLTYSPSTRSVTIQVCKIGWSLKIVSTKSVDIYKLIKI